MTSSPASPASPATAADPSRPRFRLGTRGSQLAVTQSGTVADALRALGAEVELVTVRTLGDDRPPDTTWGEGAFVGALERALLEGRVDFAVHSAKDVPTTEPDGLTIAAYPRREDPRDAIVGREPGTTLASLPHGARVGTDSPRRTAFLRAIRPDLRMHPLHGNVDTRLRRLDEGETDALVLAVAGLTRLGRADRIGEVLPSDDVPPAPGQGSLAVQCRTDDALTRAWLARLDDPDTRAAVEAERAFLTATGGGCRAPIGTHARVVDGELRLRATTAGVEAPLVPAGERPILATGEVRGPVADRRRLALELAGRLAAELATARRDAGLPVAPSRPRVLVTRPLEQTGPLVAELDARGLEAVVVPAVEIVPAPAGGPLDAAVAASPAGSWIVASSPNAARAALQAAERTGIDPAARRWAAVGPGTRDALRDAGLEPAFVPATADGAAVAAELPLVAGEAVLLPRSAIADASVETTLTARGAVVTSAVAYGTIAGPETSRRPLAAALAAGRIDAIVLASPSAVRGLLSLASDADRPHLLAALAACIGETTAAAAREAGFGRVAVAGSATPGALAARLTELLEG